MKRVLVVIGLLISIIAISYISSNKLSILINLGEISDKPSFIYSTACKLLYRISDDEIKNFIIGRFKNDSDFKLINSYIKIAGVIGIKDASADMIKLYVKIQDDSKYKNTIYYLVSSMGLNGDRSFEPILKTLLEKYNSHNLQIPQYIIARSLYLLTGDSYLFHSENGATDTVYVTSKLRSMREIIKDSSNRSRTYEEKMALNDLFNKPE